MTNCISVININIFSLLRHMDGGWIGRTEEQRKLRERATAEVLIECEKERAKLQHCFKTSWFGWCGKEQKQFWACFSSVSLHYRNTTRVSNSWAWLRPPRKGGRVASLFSICTCMSLASRPGRGYVLKLAKTRAGFILDEWERY